MQEKPSVKILIGYHKKDVLFKDDILTPIHLGREGFKLRNDPSSSAYEWMMNNMIGDDTGDNISLENPYYNELTGVYWAWKNYDTLGNPDYIGFMHYRRHFIFKKIPDMIDIELNQIDEQYLKMINYSKENLLSLLNEHTIIFHGGVVDSIYKHYSDNHEISQLDDVLKLIDTETPELSKVAHEYMKQKWGSFCNMFILPKKIFFEYCEWLFFILTKYVSCHDMSGRRLFISERLTGIYFQNLINKGFDYIDLPITLLKDTMNVSIAIPYENNLFDIITLINSHKRQLNKSTNLNFYIIGNLDDSTILNIQKYSNYCGINIFVIKIPDEFERYYGIKTVMILPKLLPHINKIVFMTTKLLCTKDCGEFFRTSNVDDYWILELPNDSINNISPTDLMVLNLKKLREHKITERLLQDETTDCTPYESYHRICGDHIGNLPYWMYIPVIKGDKKELYDKYDSRGDLQYKAKWFDYIYYNGYGPKEKVQGIYSLSWWDAASTVPGFIEKSPLSIGTQWDALVLDQKYINSSKIPHLSPKNTSNNEKGLSKIPKVYKKYGLVETIRLCFRQVKRRH